MKEWMDDLVCTPVSERDASFGKVDSSKFQAIARMFYYLD
jgi:hypothetical protein